MTDYENQRIAQPGWRVVYGYQRLSDGAVWIYVSDIAGWGVFEEWGSNTRFEDAPGPDAHYIQQTVAPMAIRDDGRPRRPPPHHYQAVLEPSMTFDEATQQRLAEEFYARQAKAKTAQ